MARKITTQAAAALFANKTFKQSNTRVEGGALYLHGNKIAWIQNGRFCIFVCVDMIPIQLANACAALIWIYTTNAGASCMACKK